MRNWICSFITDLDRTFVISGTKLLVPQYLFLLKTDHPGAVLVTGNLDGPSDQCGPFSQWFPISFSSNIYWRSSSLVQHRTKQVRPLNAQLNLFYCAFEYRLEYHDDLCYSKYVVIFWLIGFYHNIIFIVILWFMLILIIQEKFVKCVDILLVSECHLV